MRIAKGWVHATNWPPTPLCLRSPSVSESNNSQTPTKGFHQDGAMQIRFASSNYLLHFHMFLFIHETFLGICCN